MTAAGPAGTAGSDGAVTPGDARRSRSVRERAAALASGRARRVGTTTGSVRGLLMLVLALEVVHLLPVLAAGLPGTSLGAHGMRARELAEGVVPLRGFDPELPPPHAPGFAALLAVAMRATGRDAVSAGGLLHALWLPVLAVGTFLFARRLTGRPWVALLAATLTVFAGGYDLRAEALGTAALAISGHVAWPLHPRDLALGLLPWGVHAYLRALDATAPGGATRWAAAAGLAFGATALVEPTTLLPVPLALVATAAVHESRGGSPRIPIAVSILVTGLVAIAVAAPWLTGLLTALARGWTMVPESGGAIGFRQPGTWSYPAAFGLMLPLATLGSGVALLFLRRRDGPRPAGLLAGRWGPRPVAGPALLVAWAVPAFAIGALWAPDWPAASLLRPDHAWLLASQPMAILAAIGLAATTEEVVEGRLHRPHLTVPATVIVTAMVTLPVTAANVALVLDEPPRTFSGPSTTRGAADQYGWACPPTSSPVVLVPARSSPRSTGSPAAAHAGTPSPTQATRPKPARRSSEAPIAER